MSHHRIRSGGEFETRLGYCRAVVTDDGWVHVAGTVGVDRATGAVPDAVEEQCRHALAIIGDALDQAGAGFADVVRVTYMLPDRDDFAACWPLLSDTFGAHPPAATMIECRLIDDRFKIEIEVTAKMAGARVHPA